MSYELYKEYGRAEGPLEAVIPVGKVGDEVKHLKFSGGYYVDLMREEKFEELFEASDGKRLVKEGEPPSDFVDELVRLVEENNLRVPDKHRDKVLEQAKENVGLPKDEPVFSHESALR